MNMIANATERACTWIMEHTQAERYYIFSGYSTEKRASGALLAGGKGKKVTAGALVPAPVVRAYLHTTPEQLVDMWRHTLLGHVQANAIGYNGHYANGLTALFIACGQDVANIANAAVGITHFEQVAKFSKADIDKISQSLSFKDRITRDNWMEGARKQYELKYGKKLG